jgi:hypothetical protein
VDQNRQALDHQSDEALESQIVSARAALRHNLILLEEKITPSAIMERRRHAIERRLFSWRLQAREQWAEIVDTSESLQHGLGESMEHTVRETTSRATELPGQAISSIRQSSYSRPVFIAGLAFLVGWGISRVIPMSRREEEIAARVAPIVGEKAGRLVEEAKSAVAQSAKEAMIHRRM